MAELPPPVLNAPTPRLLAAEGSDHLVHMVLVLATELSAALDEVETLRQLLVARGVITEAEARGEGDTDTMQRQRATRREKLVRSLLASVEQEGARISRHRATGGQST
jgi:hypothetical protein